ncbi:hypothetical protein CU098_005646 [Rhizopus stolonifer]|uniref:Myosin motor domain-containing protein n=1 Tax=Rhizopus stolonifer TaxID=4846 RepID=A0A367KM66_RHIST|nr:hypothetical protein CU098_005646 [Rhizopus stolonifer]
MSPTEVKSSRRLGSMIHSHGMEVYHKHQPITDLDAGFNLQKLAWIEQDDSFIKVKVLEDLKEGLLVEYEDRSQTYSGLFLVAVNPYRNLPIYSSDIIRHYRKKRRGEAPPHIYAIADHAFYDMLHDKENQSILITGESGAGKTENTKIVIQYLASIAGNGSHGFSTDRASPLEVQILQANPILEAFGNAQTIRNNNSSRFGKFIRITFNRNGDIRGAFIDWYLLETSRVHTQATEERSYHIFYQLLNASAEMKRLLNIEQKCPADFIYTKHSNPTIQGVDDAAEYTKLLQSMDTIGISAEERLEFFRIVVAILYLGNIVVHNQFGRVEIKHYETACELLGVSPVLFKKHLLEPQIRAGNEWVSQSKSPGQVKDHLDALAKVLYERNFGHLVTRVNTAIDGPQSLKDMTEGERFIGVLDIAGFEIFKINSFEQLCINYTNEKLQDFFNQNMFVLEEKEYKKENIQCDDSFDYRNDLQPTIDLIESIKNPIGILSCLEDECVTQGTDDRLLSKIYEQNTHNPRFKRDMYNEGFSIKHYAGQVKYSTAGWIDRGKDPLNEHVARLFAESTNTHIANLFKDYAPEPTPSRSTDIRKTALFRTRKGGGNFHTVGYKHKLQLSALMTTLHNTHPHFVRCILPNDRKRPGQIQPSLVLHQLRCNGVLEGIRICRVGYPNRLPFEQFRKQYKLLSPDLVAHITDHRQACEILLKGLPLGDNYQLGKTKVFFKAGVLAQIERERDLRLSETVTKIQAACLGMMTRRRLSLRQSQDQLIRTIQRNARIYISMRQSRLWKVFHRRKELQFTFGSDNAVQKKMEDLEQILVATQEQLQSVLGENEVQTRQMERQEADWQLAYQELQKQQVAQSQMLEKELLETREELEGTQEALRQSEMELREVKELSEEQALVLSKMHKDVQEESEENESLMIQCDELCKENQELQEKVQILQEDQGATNALKEKLDYKGQENDQLRQNIREVEIKYAQDVVKRDQQIDSLNHSLQLQKGEQDQLRLEYEMLQKKMQSYMGDIHEKTMAHNKIHTQLTKLETSLLKETDEKRSFQKKNTQLERDVDMLTRLVQNEAKESRARAER